MIALLIFLILIGVGLYLVGQIPMDPAIHNIIRLVVLLCVILWVIQAFGLLDMPLPRFHR